MSIRLACVSFVLLLGLSGSASAQLQSGNISGTVKDEQGAVLPGTVVTLEGAGPVATFTTLTDGQYRFLNVPPGSYKLTVTLAGFGTVVRDQVVVQVGQNVDIPIALKVAALQESVTVSGQSPVVDMKQMGTATNFNADELSKVPNSRDPWALLRTVPGVALDRVNA